MFRNSVSERAATPVFAAILSDDSGTVLEDVQTVTCFSVADNSLASSGLCTGPGIRRPRCLLCLTLHRRHSCLLSQVLRVVKALPTIDLFLSYTKFMSPAHSYYATTTSPITPDVPDTSEYLSPGSPAAMDRFLAGDGDLRTVRWTYLCYRCHCCRFRPACSVSGVCRGFLSGGPVSIIYGCVA